MSITRLAGIDPAMPYSFLITLLAIPMAVRLLRKGVRRRAPDTAPDFAMLDGATAQLNLAFGLLATGALVLSRVVG